MVRNLGQVIFAGEEEVNIMNKALAKQGIAMLTETHDLELAENAQRIIHLQDGKIVTKEESDLYE